MGEVLCSIRECAHWSNWRAWLPGTELYTEQRVLVAEPPVHHLNGLEPSCCLAFVQHRTTQRLQFLAAGRKPVPAAPRASWLGGPACICLSNPRPCRNCTERTCRRHPLSPSGPSDWLFWLDWFWFTAFWDWLVFVDSCTTTFTFLSSHLLWLVTLLVGE